LTEFALYFKDAIATLHRWCQMKPKPKDLASLDPLFTAFPDSILFAKNVRQFNSQGDPNERTLLVAKSGLYLLKKKSFPRVFFIRRQIGFKSLATIIFTNSNVTFLSADAQFVISHPKHLKITARVYATRVALYPNVPIMLDCDQKYESDIKTLWPYSSSSLLADRFIGCVKPLFTPANATEAVQLQEKLKITPHSIDFDRSLCESPFIASVCEVVSYDSQVNEMVIRVFSVGSHLSVIWKNCESMRRVVFRDLSFADHVFAPIRDLFVGDGLYRIEEFAFEHCNFEADNSERFFELFSKYNGTIKALLFPESTFGKKALDALFQSIFFSKSIHSLSTLRLTNIQYPTDLSAFFSMLGLCEWVVTTHCLATISLINCGLEVGRLLPELLKCDSGFANLDFTGNSFLEPIHVSLPLLSSLNVSRCRFTSSSLLSLFEALGAVSDHGLRLTASHLCGLDENFYIDLMWTALPSLTSLVWDGNFVTPSTCACFCAFLKNQAKLTELSIAGCLSSEQFNLTAPLLADLFTAKSIESVDFSNNPVGPALIPVIEAVLTSPCLASLDISGTLVGEAAIDLIFSRKPPTLATLNFEMFACTTPESLLAIVRRLITDPQITSSRWPQADADQFPAFAELAFERRKFAVKFGGQISVKGEAMPTGKKAALKEKEQQRHHSGSISRNQDGLTRYADYGGEVMELLQECGEVIGDDPMDTLLEQVRVQTAIPTMIQELRTLMKRSGG
jgi:hypothetical protein